MKTASQTGMLFTQTLKYRIIFLSTLLVALAANVYLIHIDQYGVLLIWIIYYCTTFILIRGYNLTDHSLEVKNILLKSTAKSIPYDRIERIAYRSNRRGKLRSVRIDYTLQPTDPQHAPGHSWIVVYPNIDLELFLEELQKRSGIEAQVGK